MEYDNLHNIVSKEQLHQKAPGQSGGIFTDILSTTYKLDYSYDANNKPHAPRIIEDKPYQTSPVSEKKFKNYDYDPNGNLTNITQKTGESDVVEKLRTNLWDEENRLRAVDITPDAEGVRPIAIYTYDAGGERVLKHSNTSVSIYLNGKKVADTIQVDATLYPSGMTVFRPSFGGEGGGSYTKHYFAGTQRVSSKIGTTENLGDYLYDWFTQGTGGPVDVIGSSFGVLENSEQGVIQVYDEFDIEPPVYDSNPVFIPVQSFVHGGSELEQYYFHPDHLGSTSYITNLLGEVSQHMEYFAFGETFVEEHRSSNNSPYKFNGKELDEETGWYYYGARYYDPRGSVWLSVDPLANVDYLMNNEAYINGEHNGGVFNSFNHNSYGYCYQNPILYIDPNGKQTNGTETRVNEIRANYENMITSSRNRGYDFAADNLQHFIDGKGGTKEVSLEQLQKYNSFNKAISKNQKRFENQLSEKANLLKDGQVYEFSDYWDAVVDPSIFSELYYASGKSQIKSEGSFIMTRKDDIVTIKGVVKNTWSDPYDWNPGMSAFIPGYGNVSDDDGIFLRNYGGARDFMLESKSSSELKGKININDYWWNFKDFQWTDLEQK